MNLFWSIDSFLHFYLLFDRPILRIQFLNLTFYEDRHVLIFQDGNSEGINFCIGPVFSNISYAAYKKCQIFPVSTSYNLYIFHLNPHCVQASNNHLSVAIWPKGWFRSMMANRIVSNACHQVLANHWIFALYIRLQIPFVVMKITKNSFFQTFILFYFECAYTSISFSYMSKVCSHSVVVTEIRHT